MAHTNNQARLARELGISRQAVSKLIKNGERTGFPAATADGWDITAVRNWYIKFDPRKGPKAGIKKS